jgi:hypothetical protein
MTEQEAHDEILSRCRSHGEGWVMRQLFDGTRAVLDLYRTEPKPGGYQWERQDTRISVGSTWLAVLEGMPPA